MVKAAPTGLDWWVAKATPGGAPSVVWPMTDGSYAVVIMNANGKPGVDGDVALGLTIKGMFATAMLIVAAGAVLLIGGILLVLLGGRRSRRRAASASAPAPQASDAAVTR